MTTQKQALSVIRAMGLSVRVVEGEYRVNYPKGAESTAYYTDDPDDAIGTARQMNKSNSYRQANGWFGSRISLR